MKIKTHMIDKIKNYFQKREELNREKRLQELKSQVKFLNLKYENYFNKYCIYQGKIYAYKKFILDENLLKIKLIYMNENGLYENDYYFMKLMFEGDFIINHRNNFVALKEELKKYDLEIIHTNKNV